jgi:hypothetical protein
MFLKKYLVLAYELFKVFYARFGNIFVRHVLNVIAVITRQDLCMSS